MKTRNIVLAVILVLAMAFMFAIPVMAQAENPPVAGVAEPASPFESEAALVAFTILITGFFKQQLGLTNSKMILLTGFVTMIVLLFLPDLQAILPAKGAYLIDKFILGIKLFLSAAGFFDTTVNIGAKIATATKSAKGVLSTSEPL